MRAARTDILYLYLYIFFAQLCKSRVFARLYVVVGFNFWCLLALSHSKWNGGGHVFEFLLHVSLGVNRQTDSAPKFIASSSIVFHTAAAFSRSAQIWTITLFLKIFSFGGHFWARAKVYLDADEVWNYWALLLILIWGYIENCYYLQRGNLFSEPLDCAKWGCSRVFVRLLRGSHCFWLFIFISSHLYTILWICCVKLTESGAKLTP